MNNADTFAIMHPIGTRMHLPSVCCALMQSENFIKAFANLQNDIKKGEILLDMEKYAYKNDDVFEYPEKKKTTYFSITKTGY